jgi:hypothetical protein
MTCVPSDVPRVTFFTEIPKCSRNRIVGVNPLSRGASVENSGKLVTLEASRLMKFVMQVFRGKELMKIWSLELTKPRNRECAVNWTPELSKSRSHERAMAQNLEPTTP